MKLLDTTYKAGPQDQLIVKDVYAAAGSSVYNSFQSSMSDALRAIDKIPGLGSGLLGKINSAINTARSMVNNIGAIGKSPMSLLGAAGLGSLGGMLNAGAGLGDIKNIAANVFGSMGGVSQIASAVNALGATMNNINMLSRDLKNIGNFPVTSQFGLQSAVGGLLSQAMGGNSGEFASLLVNIANTNNYARTSVSKNLSGSNNTITGKGYATSTKSLPDIFSGTNPAVKSSLSNLPDSVKDTFVNSASNQNFSSDVVAATTKAVSKLADGEEMQAAQTLVELVSNITDGVYAAEITNKNEQAALIAAVTHVAASLELPGVFDAIAATIKDETILQKAAAPLLNQAIIDGDFDMVRSLANSKIASSLKAIAPDVTGAIVKVVKKPRDIAQQDYSKYYQSIRISLDTIDPKWSTYKRGNSVIINASMFCENFFVGDLIRAQMNELMSPNTYFANAQRVYADRTDIQTDVTESLSVVMYNKEEGDGDNEAVDFSDVLSQTSANLGPDDVGVLTTELKVVVPAKKKAAEEEQVVDSELDSIESYADYLKYLDSKKGDLKALALQQANSNYNPVNSATNTDSSEDDEAKEITISFENEPFMLIATMFCQDSVDACLKRDFPNWYTTLDNTPIVGAAFL